MQRRKDRIKDQPTHVALRNLEHEKAAQYMAFTPKPNAEELAKRVGVEVDTARRYLSEPVLLSRSKHLASGRLTGLVGAAIHALAGLLQSDSERIRLDAAKEILDRGGVRGEISPVSHQPFQVKLVFGGFENRGLSSVTPPLEEIFSEEASVESRKSPRLEEISFSEASVEPLEDADYEEVGEEDRD